MRDIGKPKFTSGRTGVNYLSGSMLTGDFSPRFPVKLIEKDFNYTVQARV